MEWGPTLSGSLLQTFTAPFASLHQIAQVACYDSTVVCIVHILITFDKDQFQSKTYSQQSSEGYWVLVCRELATSKCMHSLYRIWFLSETWGVTRSTFSMNRVLTRSNILFELGTPTFWIYEGFLEQKSCLTPISESTRILIFQTHECGGNDMLVGISTNYIICRNANKSQKKLLFLNRIFLWSKMKNLFEYGEIFCFSKESVYKIN